MVILLMGVAGSGKTTVGRLLALRMGWKFADGDDFHTAANIEKMTNGIPLTDADRASWIAALRERIVSWIESGQDAVLACSALKQAYRDRLLASPEVKLVYLCGPQQLLKERLRSRSGHFMTEQMLASQLETLEEPTDALVLNIQSSPEELVDDIVTKLKLGSAIQARRKEGQEESIQTRVVRRLTWRLIPFLFLLYIVAYLDRINVGFAALQMQKQLALTDAVYGLGAGMFFAGYFVFQVPSNLILQRIGARRWIALLMALWGAISASMIFVSGPRNFYTLRFLLGAAEAGFFPGVIFYLKSWFPPQARARTVARFMTAAPLSGVIGGPLSGFLLGIHVINGLSGWQGMFLIEGIPAIVLGGVALKFLTDHPEDARWLPLDEKDWLIGALRREHAEMPSEIRAFDALHNIQIWMLALVYFGLNTVSYGVSLWLPTLIQSLSGLGSFTIGVLSAIPYVAAAVTMVLMGLHSDRTGERRWHTALPAFVGAIALTCAAYSTSVGLAILGISVAVLGVFSMVGPFWAMPASLLSGAAAAVGIAFINAVGNLGGFAGPYVIGLVRTSTGKFRGGLLVVSVALMVSGFLALMVRPNENQITGRPGEKQLH